MACDIISTMKNDIIVAVSTPIGMGAISIVRMSGDGCLLIAKKIFSSQHLNFDKIEPRKLYLGTFSYGEINDECLLVYFKNPFSYTGEDLVEFQIHGSTSLVDKVISACLKNGARMASEGEFTKRAFVNGKISLEKAEGVIDTINAESENELKAAKSLMQGKLFSQIREMQNDLTSLLARLEVALDYPEHDIEYTETQNAKKELENIKTKLEKILENSDQNSFIKNGVNVAIVGRVNSGKSSLLNALLGENRAIVTNIEGTTRDIVRETINYKGLKINFIDTAGIRKSEDAVENIGIEKSFEQINSADVVLFVYDSSRKLNNEERETLEKLKDKNHIIIANKSDLNRVGNDISPDIEISALKEQNIDEVKQRIYNLSKCGKINFNEICLTNARHIEAIKQSINYISKAISCCDTETVDIVILEIKKAWESLGKITGETENESIIDAIFSKFCLGK